MSAPALRIEAPSDAQLRYIASLCDEHGVPFPGTPADPLYVADEPRDETEQAREALAETEARWVA